MSIEISDKSFNTRNVNRSTRRGKLGLTIILIGLLWLLAVAIDIQRREAWADLTIKDGALVFGPPVLILAIGITIRNKG